MADAASRIFGPSSGVLTTCFALVSLVAIANLFVTVGSRIGFAMARD